jgi:hypothetical protein
MILRGAREAPLGNLEGFNQKIPKVFVDEFGERFEVGTVRSRMKRVDRGTVRTSKHQTRFAVSANDRCEFSMIFAADRTSHQTSPSPPGEYGCRILRCEQRRKGGVRAASTNIEGILVPLYIELQGVQERKRKNAKTTVRLRPNLNG